MKFDKPATENPIDRLKVVGHPHDRIDGTRKVTGTARYAYEQHDVVPNQAYGHVIGAAIAKGRITAMDTEAARRAPQLKMMLLDLPAVAQRARARFAAEGLSGRAEAFGGDFLNQPLPRGADAASLVRVLFDHHDDNAMRILRAVRAALPADGTLLVAEPMAGTKGAEPMGDAYFGFYLLAMGQGRPRSPQELADLLVRAGFARLRLRRTRRPIVLQVISAEAV